MPPPLPVMANVFAAGLVSVPVPVICPPFQVKIPLLVTMERLPIRFTVPVFRLMLVLELVVPVSKASVPPLTLMLLLEARLLDGSSLSVLPLGMRTVVPLEPRLRMTPLTLVSTVMVVPTLTTAVSPVVGTPLGLQRVLSVQLNGRLPFVVVYVVASAAGAPAKRMAK